MTAASFGHDALQRCPRCGTELVPGALTCPACGAFVHGDQLNQLAAAATELTVAGKLVEAQATWQRALALVPESTQQHAIIASRIAELGTRLFTTPAAQLGEPPETKPWWKRGAAAVLTMLLVAASKIKFLLLGLTKASTFFSMLAFFGVYWSIFGWRFAAGLVVTIYIHEMGHVAALTRAGVKASAPMFIPGIGALVLLKQRITDPKLDARVGLAGPVWGLGAGLAAFAIFSATGAPIWGAIARGTGYLNLFNLIPIWQLDGSRGFHALSRLQRWLLVAVIAVAWLVTHQGMLLIIGAVAIYRALEQAVAEPDRTALITFAILIGALAWLSSIGVAMPL